jgi:hypothetical protein
MTVERMLRFLILRGINNDACENRDFANYLKNNHDLDCLLYDYKTLGDEFLQEYALETPRKRE